MSNIVAEHHPDRCPIWCDDHQGSVHRSSQSVVPTFGDDTTAHVSRVGGGEERIVVNGKPHSVGQASDLARAILRLVNHVESPEMAQSLDRGDVATAAQALIDDICAAKASA
jgi:hypothetical protein